MTIAVDLGRKATKQTNKKNKTYGTTMRWGKLSYKCGLSCLVRLGKICS